MDFNLNANGGELYERVKSNLLVYGNNLQDNFINNSTYFYNLYNKSIDSFENIPVGKIADGGFYFFHYEDESNWMKWSPVFVAGFKKFENKIILLAVNLNFLPLQVRVILFDKFITEKDFEQNNLLKVDYQGVYNKLQELGFEYALMEFDASKIKIVHRCSLSLLPRFLFHQHPKNKYDPGKLMDIWSKKLETRQKRHEEISKALLSDFYDTGKEITEKYSALENHIKRIRRNL